MYRNTVLATDRSKTTNARVPYNVKILTVNPNGSSADKIATKPKYIANTDTITISKPSATGLIKNKRNGTTDCDFTFTKMKRLSWVTPYSCMSNKRKLTTNTEYYATKKMKQTTDDDIDKPNGLVLKVWKLNETPTFSLDTKTSPRVYSSNNASTTTESIDIDSAESDNDGPSLYDVPPRDLNEKKKNPPSYDSFLTATTWYSGDTINAYLSLIASRSQGKVHYLITDFMKALSRRGYAGVKRWIKIDIHSLKLLLVPMHVNDNHWTMTVVDVPEKTITFFDSLNSYNGPYPSLFRQFLIEWEIENYGYSSQWTLRYGKAVQQRNGYDCGPLSLELAEKMSRDDGTPINPLAMPYVRLRHKYELEAGTLFQF
ncbi:uncharacterized protein LOC126909358 isoform X2 [Daktulosphaira vitifoliae]|uniref:uncharacterized protein LOC126909358 isoform X2 n=1 Tax=Daktulosphaira vitifoliae TaxID=58002 RepID=UPI0021AA7821|nr:uncharacterized protein LOC126909358 isoform X2 [Daktulosphaira vitifoliae]